MSVCRYNRYWIEKFEEIYQGERTMWRSTVNDASVLPKEFKSSNWVGLSFEDYQIYPYSPVIFWISVIYAAVGLPLGITLVLEGFIGEHYTISTELGWTGITMLVFLYGLWKYQTAIHAYRKFIVFDRKCRLVHIPRIRGKEFDSTPFDEADFALAEVPGHMRLHFMSFLFVCRPPGDLSETGVHDGVKKYLVRLLGDNMGEWSYIVDYMKTN